MLTSISNSDTFNKPNLIRMVNYVRNISQIFGIINTTFLDPTPKYHNPSYTKSLKKVTYKVIANHLKPILPLLISPNQGSFVNKRQMIDNIIIVQATIHSSRYCKGKAMVIKLDIVCSFDRVRHSFF